jgi:hypothetical protein
MTGRDDPQHRASETTGGKRLRESKSLGWLLFRDQDLRLLVGLPITAILGIAMFVVGVLSGEVWMIVVGAIFALVSLGGLYVVLRPRRIGRQVMTELELEDGTFCWVTLCVDFGSLT